MKKQIIDKEYILEIHDLLEEAETAILNFQKREDFFENWNIVMRVLHSVKGSAGMYGLKLLEAHVHKVEDICMAFNYKEHQSHLEEVSGYLLTTIDQTRIFFERSGAYDFNEMLYFKSIGELFSLIDTDVIDEATNFDFSKSEEKDKVVKVQKPRYKISVIDDDNFHLNYYKKLLENQNHECSLFSDPEEALLEILKSPPDVIITDYVMPGLNGIEIHKEIEKAGFNIPTIFATGANDPEVFEKLSHEGAFAIITKPINKSMLIYTLNQTLKIVEKQRTIKSSLKALRSHFASLTEYYELKGMNHRIRYLKDEIEELYKN